MTVTKNFITDLRVILFMVLQRFMLLPSVSRIKSLSPNLGASVEIELQKL